MTNSIERLEAIYGPIKYKIGKGDVATRIITKLNATRQHREGGPEGGGFDDAGEIEGLVLVDRTTDLVTPFCIQQTYEGLLDETFDIRTCSVRVDNAILKQDDEESKGKGGRQKDLKDGGSTNV